MLEFVPETVYGVARQYQKSKQALPVIYVKVGDILPPARWTRWGDWMRSAFSQRFIFINCAEHWPTSMRLAYATVTSSHKTCCWIQHRTC